MPTVGVRFWTLDGRHKGHKGPSARSSRKRSPGCGLKHGAFGSSGASKLPCTLGALGYGNSRGWSHLLEERDCRSVVLLARTRASSGTMPGRAHVSEPTHSCRFRQGARFLCALTWENLEAPPRRVALCSVGLWKT
jgi:hypothetical protein